jgi:hypothetical protein
VQQNLNLAVLVRVYLGLQKGALSAKCGSIASEKLRICSPKETETVPQNLDSAALELTKTHQPAFLREGSQRTHERVHPSEVLERRARPERVCTTASEAEQSCIRARGTPKH